jgi:hypothetical protein
MFLRNINKPEKQMRNIYSMFSNSLSSISKHCIQNSVIFAVFVFTFVLSCKNSEEKTAFNFLKSQMHNKGSSEKKVVSNSGVEIHFYPYNFETLYQANDSLEKLIKHNLVFNRYYNDSEFVPDSFIRKHAKRLIEIKRKSPALKKTGTNVFYEFVLPYRGGDEIFEDYYSTVERIFGKASKNFSISLTTLEKVNILNAELSEILEFDLRSHAMLKEPSICEVLSEGKGSCNSLTAVAVQTMRFFGIPTVIDECPVWAHRNSGHRWNAFLNDDGKWIPFSGAETNPDEFNVINDSVKAPKIFRHTFSVQKDFQPPVENAEDIPPVFRYPNRIDVTKQYVSTTDVEISPDSEKIGGEKIIYLAVFNDEEWRIVSWAKLENGKAVFRKTSNNNIVYLPASYKNGKIIPVASPFILSGDSVINIVPDTSHKTDLELKYHNVFFDLKWNIGITNAGRQTELYYWNNDWILCGECKVGNDHLLRFQAVPQNALYWIKSNEWDNTWQRIFTVENGEQVWY